MGVIYTLTGTQEARGWLALAREAYTEDDKAACLRAHRRMMTKIEVTTTDDALSNSVAGRLAVQARRSRGRA